MGKHDTPLKFQTADLPLTDDKAESGMTKLEKSDPELASLFKKSLKRFDALYRKLAQ
ncbi:MAG: hypothetical protein ACR2P4_01525 [Gammaproteobacteria bacterium]